MNDTVLVLGAGGCFGRAATTAFGQAGWRVRTLARTLPPTGREAGPAGLDEPDRGGRPGIDIRIGDPRDAATLDAAVDGVDVVVHAINPPYGRWAREAMPLARSTIEAAARHGATVLLPGNVYPHGRTLPARLDEATPFAPSEALGRIRAEMEEAFRDASARGVRTIVLRAGDFVAGERTGQWFEDHVLGRLDRDRVVYPGPLDRPHAWAWLPDLAAAAVGLAAIRDRLAPFEAVGFPGWSPTGEELVRALERVTGRALEVRSMPWPLLRLVAPFSADIRGVVSMRWLWERPHAIDGARLAELLPGFRPVGLESGLRLALDRLGEPLAEGEARSASAAEACR